MAALTDHRDGTYWRNIDESNILGPFDVAAGETIYDGALVAFDASGDIVPLSDTANLTFAGIARKGADNSGGSAGDETVYVIPKGEVLVTLGAALAASGLFGTVLYGDDDQTLDVVANVTNNIPVGVGVERVSATSWWVAFDAVALSLADAL